MKSPLHLASLEEAAPRPGTEGLRGPDLSHSHRRRRAGGIETQEQPRALSLPALHPAERGRWGKVHDLELGLALAEPCLESRPLLERPAALDGVAARQPLRDAAGIGEEGEDLNDRGADGLDERMTDGSHGSNRAGSRRQRNGSGPCLLSDALSASRESFVCTL